MSSKTATCPHLPAGASEEDARAGLVPTLLQCLDKDGTLEDPAHGDPAHGGGSFASMAPSPIAAELWAPSQRLELMRRSFKLLTNLAVAYPRSVCGHPALGPLVSGYLEPDTPPELRDAAIHMLVAALPASVSGCHSDRHVDSRPLASGRTLRLAACSGGGLLPSSGGRTFGRTSRVISTARACGVPSSTKSRSARVRWIAGSQATSSRSATSLPRSSPQKVTTGWGA